MEGLSIFFLTKCILGTRCKWKYAVVTMQRARVGKPSISRHCLVGHDGQANRCHSVSDNTPTCQLLIANNMLVQQMWWGQTEELNLTIILTQRVTIQSFHSTLQPMKIYHHTKIGCKVWWSVPNNNNDSGQFYSTVSHWQGWTHCATLTKMYA